jgi:hypothetical protein
MLKAARILLVPAALVAVAMSCSAAGQQKVFTDPADAGPDFAIQGEYVGMVATEIGEVKEGAHVIALGDGKFRAVGYHGGLPGEGWLQTDKPSIDGQLKDGVVVLKVPDTEYTATLKDGKMTVKEGSKVIATLSKVERRSPTLGQKPPAGAIVLFDGASAERFSKGRMTKDGLLMQGAASKQLFQSYQVHVEFRLPFQPLDRGQDRGNSGLYAQGRYEVQILDSFGLDGKDNECGGIYQVAAPRVNMCFPPLAWQTYDVDFTAAVYKDGKKVQSARMTVRHNGVLIHENVEVPHATVAAILKEGPEPGPVYLQDHGNPVRFRNVWVVEKK